MEWTTLQTRIERAIARAELAVRETAEELKLAETTGNRMLIQNIRTKHTRQTNHLNGLRVQLEEIIKTLKAQDTKRKN